MSGSRLSPGPAVWDLERCGRLGRHQYTNTHASADCPHRLADPKLQAQWDRFDEAQQTVLRATSSTHFGATPDEAGRLKVSMSLEEFERLAAHIGRLGQLKRLLRELVG